VKNILFILICSLFLVGCTDEKHCLDGTKWKSTSDDSIMEFRDGKVFVGVVKGFSIAGSYDCGDNNTLYLSNMFVTVEAKIKGNKIIVEGQDKDTWIKQ